MARQLIDSFAGDWQPEKYDDTYRDALRAVIEAKRKGKEVHVAAEPEEERPTDLLEALRASVDASKRGQRRPARGSSNGARRDELEELPKSELEQRARDADIEGRSKMSKEELIEALRAAA
jgi:DNA end-binding protein Ku